MAFSGRKLALLAVIGAACIPALLLVRARGSDHADTPAIAARPGTDLTDVFLFPSPTNANNVVLVLCVHPLIPTGQGPGTAFDPNVLYQFKIDNTGDFVEDYVIQVTFTGTGASQQVRIATGRPATTGTNSRLLTPDPSVGTINTPFTTSTGIQVFAGAREDPFFFDLNQFLTILPDRANSLGPSFTNTNGQTVTTTPTDPDMPMAATFRSAGQAQDFLKGLNVLSIVVELPKSQLIGTNGSKINLWCTTSI
jgi:hypothetical protein